MTSGFAAQPDQHMPSGPMPQQPQAANASPGFAAFAATTQADYQNMFRNDLLNTLGLTQLIQLCDILNNLPFVAALRGFGDQTNNGATGSIFQAIGNLISPLTTAVSAFIHTYDNIDWNNPATIIPTILRDVITSTWNLFWDLIKWAIQTISTITSQDITKGTKFLSDLANFLEFSTLQAAFNTFLNTWTSLDFLGAPLTALPAGFIAFVDFLQAVASWALDVINKLLGILFPGWFKWAELGAVWTKFRTDLQAITWTNIPVALLAFVTAAIKALQGIGRWILDVFTGLIGSNYSVIHSMFADPIAFLNQMITYFFGNTGLTKWTDALNWVTGIIGSTPIAALNTFYAQLQTLGDLFTIGNLSSGNILGALTTFFNQFTSNFSSFPTTLQNSLTSLFTGAADLVSTVMAQVMSLIGNLSVSNLVGTAQNLLLNPGFSSSISLFDPNNMWTWDDNVFLTGIGVTTPGSAKITATGVLNALRSNTIAVTAGKTLNMAINVLTNGLVGTGTPLLLQAITDAGTTTIASSGVPSGSPSGWTGAPPTAQATTLSGSYTVPASGVSTLTLRLVVDAAATAGTVWWDGANLATSGLVPPTLVGGIGGTPNIGSALQQTWDTVSNTIPNAGTLPLITQRLDNLLPQSLWQAQTGAGTNLIMSPQFEDNTIVRSVGSFAGTGFTSGYTTAVARSGTQSYFMQTSSAVSGQNDVIWLTPNNYGAITDQYIKCQPGQWFYGEIYVRAKATNTITAGTIFWRLDLIDSTGVSAENYSTFQNISESGLPSSAWTKLSGWAQIPAGYDKCCPLLVLAGQNVAAQTFYLDDARCVEETQAQALTQQLFGGSNVLPTIVSAAVPSLDASKIISGIFNTPQIPALPISQITSLPSYLSNLSTSGILNATSGLSGVVPIGQIPTLPISQTTNLSGYLTNLNPFGQFTSAVGLPNLFQGIAPTATLGKSNINDLNTTYSAAQNAGNCSASMSRAAGLLTVGSGILSGYFDTVDRYSGGMTLTPASALFQIPSTIAQGYYRCDICLAVNPTFVAVWATAPVLYKNGSIAQLGHDAISVSIAGGGVNARYIKSSFTIQLAAGDYVQAGVQTTGSPQLTGGGPTVCYFTITLTNQQVT